MATHSLLMTLVPTAKLPEKPLALGRQDLMGALPADALPAKSGTPAKKLLRRSVGSWLKTR